MSRRRMVDFRPIATPGWIVAVLRVDRESSVLEKRLYPLAGYAILRDAAGATTVSPAWHVAEGDLVTGENAHAFAVLMRETDPDWAELRSVAIDRLRRGKRVW